MEQDGYMIAIEEAGEAGLFNRFYRRDRLVELLKNTLGLMDIQAMHVRFGNYQAGELIAGNSDIVIWGRAA